MSDLTKRLRDLDDRIKAHFERGPGASIGPGACGEAADRIDALEAALRELCNADSCGSLDDAMFKRARALIGEV